MGPTLGTLPKELLLHVYSFLSSHDLAQLATVSKGFGPLAETLIWTDVELHCSGYHESTRQSWDLSATAAPAARRYHPDQGRWAHGHGHRLKAESLFWLLDLAARSDIEHTKQLVSRIRSLCTVLSWLNPPTWVNKPDRLEFTWNIFPLMTNLERLELHGGWKPYHDGEGRSFDESAAPLASLRDAKLFGYLPASFVRYILRSAPTLERLELGVLDAPVGCNLKADGSRENPPPGWKPRSERDEEDDDNSDDDDSLNGEQIAPRPLPLFPGDTEVPAFPRLKHIRLCKPSECNPDHFDAMFGEVVYSKRAEDASLSDWCRLLAAVQGTVETLVLEHRVAAEYIEGDGMGEREFIEECSGGPANDHFMERIVPVLDKHAFPHLREVYIVGILVSAGAAERRRWVTKFYGDYGVQCRFLYGKWCYFDGSPGVTYWDQFDADRDDNDDDEEVPDGP
ncbi:hypothetical protein SCUP234_13101 [Seiridium cupressi]